MTPRPRSRVGFHDDCCCPIRCPREHRDSRPPAGTGPQWDRGSGPRALLACAPGERLELGLIVFGLALRQHGWGITYLGADTPIDTLAAAVGELELAAVVVVAVTAERLDPIRDPLAQLADGTRLLLAGTGADEKFAATIGAELLEIRSLLLQS
jgi:hypothetical protein